MFVEISISSEKYRKSPKISYNKGTDEMANANSAGPD